MSTLQLHGLGWVVISIVGDFEAV